MRTNPEKTTVQTPYIVNIPKTVRAISAALRKGERVYWAYTLGSGKRITEEVSGAYTKTFFDGKELWVTLVGNNDDYVHPDHEIFYWKKDK